LGANNAWESWFKYRLGPSWEFLTDSLIFVF
jgi:hypothetical protein